MTSSLGPAFTKDDLIPWGLVIGAIALYDEWLIHRGKLSLTKRWQQLPWMVRFAAEAGLIAHLEQLGDLFHAGAELLGGNHCDS